MTWSASSRWFRRRSSRPTAPAPTQAFTLLEILVTIAIMAMLAGVLLVGANRVLSDQPKTPDEIFWKAVREARKSALRSERPVELSFDSDERSFVLTTEAGAHKTFPLQPGRKIEIDFLQARTGAGYVLLGGELVETQKIPRVTFYPDGTCDPFRVQLRGQTGEPWSHAIDPWTCAPVLEAPKP